MDNMDKFILGLIRLYQLTLSPLLGQHCRFTPSCSQYTSEAIRKYGAAKGSWLGIKRILRCQPFCEGGHDPVP
ncbi:MAG: membrane protein insertion efficiency factor YidD [Xanthomonadales bacterium]|nr:membrane protein insertion efficiency factor YidD [Xanthomonadales bacterium]